MKTRILLLILVFFLISASVFAAYRSRGSESWDPASGTTRNFGMMVMTSTTIAWDKTQQLKYKVISSRDNYWIIEFADKPYPKFNKQACKYVKFILKFNRFSPYQILMDAYFYDENENPFRGTPILEGQYMISR